MRCNLTVLIFYCIGLTLRADGPADNVLEGVRPVPPPGIKIAETDRADLKSRLEKLGKGIDEASRALTNRPSLLQLLPDVEVFHKAVRYAVEEDEFYKSNQVAIARELLTMGEERLTFLRDGKAPWLSATGLVVRGYRSRVDGSVQPYGLVVPPSFIPGGAPLRLDFWFHGRGETLTELDFLDQRRKSPGEFVPANSLVVHLYGRYCNGNRFAGETDLFETLAHVRRHYPVDENKLVVRGFSLGGAACWHFATHHAGLWAAAAPGAGFSETADFLKVFQQETLKPTWYEQKLWHMYDATDYAGNLFNCPTIAYSGEVDHQKQAADMMAKALAAEGMELRHIIGPKTAHAYHPQAKLEINRRLDQIVAAGRRQVPRQVKFTTWTLRYNEMYWVRVDALGKHWERAKVDALLLTNGVSVRTENVERLSLVFQAGQFPLEPDRPVAVSIDGKLLENAPPSSDRSWEATFQKTGGKWQREDSESFSGLRKVHGLQGPIDDAFMDSFIFVRPTGKSLHEKTGKWVEAEMAHAIDHWRKQFRGDVRLKNDTDVQEEDIANANLVLWGDPSGNSLLAKIAPRLPVQWSVAELRLGGKKYSSESHLPIMIYPNPLNSKRYVVLNSGFTFREYDYLNNARQTSKLPDFAIVNVETGRSARWPGLVEDAGFFDENWGVARSE